jgi:uncharacterized protein
MLWGAANGAFELRHINGGARISGHFPYATETELAPGRLERIEARAFASRIDAKSEIHFLLSHDVDKPLASTTAGSLTIRETPDALEIEAELSADTSWTRDFLAAHKAGLIRGLSPGFRVAPNGDRVERRGSNVVRSITRAELMEISAVTRPAYPQAQIEARSWAAVDLGDNGLARTLNRWRA